MTIDRALPLIASILRKLSDDERQRLVRALATVLG